jgi:glyoxylase I family protein
MSNQQPFTMLGLDHLVIRCVDLEAMRQFYCDVLGCTVDRHNEEFGLFQVRAGAHLIDLIPVDGLLGRKGGPTPRDDGLNLDHFAIRVEPFEEATLRAYLADHDIEIVEAGPRYGAEGTGPSIYILDPEGNTVELKGPPEPSLN